jgi:hypothetical protein
LARDYERLATTLAGYHWLAFAMPMLKSLFAKKVQGPSGAENIAPTELET